MFNNNLNCKIEIFHVSDLDFKIIISPSYDIQMIMMRMSMIQQNQGQDLQNVQPENLCILSIDLKFDTLEIAKQFFIYSEVD